jgi:hypothetical protein
MLFPPRAAPTRRRDRLPTPRQAPTTASRQPRLPIEGNDDGEGKRVADITSAADAAKHVPPTQTNVSKSYFLNPCPGTKASVRGTASDAVTFMMIFDFIFILHVMKELIDIVNAMDDVATTKKIDSGVKRPRLEQAY